MARELTIKVTADTAQAKAQLAQIDRQLSDLSKEFLSGAISLDTYRKRLAELRAEQQRLSTALQQAASGGGGIAAFTKSLAGLSTIVAGIAGASVIGNAIRSSVAFADELTKLSDKTDISGEALQRLGFAATQSGNTLDQVASVVSMLSKRIGTRSEGVVSAIEALGLSFSKVSQSSPDEQFRMIAVAIEQIEDPARRAALGAEIMGRGFAELQPTIKAVAEGIGDDIVVMDERTRKTLDAWGDIWDAAVRRMKVAVANVTAITLESFEAIKSWVEQNSVILLAVTGAGTPKAPKERALPVPEPLKVPNEAEVWKTSESALKDYNKQLAEQNRLKEQTARAAEMAKKREEDYIASLVKAAHDKELLDIFKTPMLEARQTVPMITNLIQGQVSQITLIAERYENWAEKVQDVGDKHRGLGEEMDKVRDASKSFGFDDQLNLIDKLLTGINSKFAQLATVAVRAIGQIRDVWKSAASSGEKFAATISTSLSAAASMVGGRGGTILGGAAAGASIGMYGGWIGAGVGAGVGALAAAIATIDKAEKETNKLRDSFQKLTFGDLDAMNKAFDRVGLTLDRVLSAKTPTDFAAAVDEFNKKLNAQQSALTGVEDAMKKYGLTLEDMGQQWKQNKSDMQAADLLKDWTLLIGAGANVDTVTGKMSKSINAYVQNAMKLGTEVPAAMKPMIEEMIKLGLLTDASGKKIDDIESSGINFSQSLTEGFKSVTDAIKEMTEALKYFLGLAPKPSTLRPPAVPAPPSPATTGNENPNGFMYWPGQEAGYTYHKGGVLRAHAGMYLNPDERWIIGQTGEGILSRRGMASIGGAEVLNAMNQGQAMPPRRRVFNDAGGYIGTPIDPNYEWKSTARRSQPVVIHAPGAIFGTGAPAQLSRMISDHLSKGGPDATRFRGSQRVR